MKLLLIAMLATLTSCSGNNIQNYDVDISNDNEGQSEKRFKKFEKLPNQTEDAYND